MRASPSLTAAEVQAFTQFALDHDIIVDGEVGIQNANTLCGPIVETDSDITAQALSDSFAKVKSQLRIKSAMYRKAEALSSKLNPDEVAYIEPLTVRELQQRCVKCKKPGQCALDLADEFADPGWQSWRDYCPNAAALTMLSTFQSCSKVCK